MDLKSGNKGGEGKVEAGGLQGEHIERGDFLKYEQQIRRLRYNIITDNEEESLSHKSGVLERKEELKPVTDELRHSPGHQRLYIVKDTKNGGNAIVGFMAIDLDPLKHTAKVREMWSGAREGSQRGIIKKLLDTARTDLPQDKYSHIDVEVAAESKHFTRLTADTATYRCFHIKQAKGKEHTPEASTPSDKPDTHLERGH